MAAALPFIQAGAAAAGGVASLSQSGKSQGVSPGNTPNSVPQGGDISGALNFRQLTAPQTTQFPMGPMPNIPVPAFDQANLNQNLMSILQAIGTTKGGY